MSRETGRIYWERPENMVSEVPLSFTVIVEDMASGRTDTYEVCLCSLNARSLTVFLYDQ